MFGTLPDGRSETRSGLRIRFAILPSNSIPHHPSPFRPRETTSVLRYNRLVLSSFAPPNSPNPYLTSHDRLAADQVCKVSCRARQTVAQRESSPSLPLPRACDLLEDRYGSCPRHTAAPLSFGLSADRDGARGTVRVRLSPALMNEAHGCGELRSPACCLTARDGIADSSAGHALANSVEQSIAHSCLSLMLDMNQQKAQEVEVLFQKVGNPPYLSGRAPISSTHHMILAPRGLVQTAALTESSSPHHPPTRMKDATVRGLLAALVGPGIWKLA